MKNKILRVAEILIGATVAIVLVIVLAARFTGEKRQKEKTGVDIDSSGDAEVCSQYEHFSITVKGKLDKTKIPDNLNLLEYKIRIFVHPAANAEGWWGQNPAEALENWVAQAFLGGTGKYSAQEGETFQIFAVLSKAPLKAPLKDMYRQRSEILQEPHTYAISPVKAVITHRQCQ